MSNVDGYKSSNFLLSPIKVEARAVAIGNHSLSGCGHGSATVHVSAAEQTGPDTGVSVREGVVRGECEEGGSVREGVVRGECEGEGVGRGEYEGEGVGGTSVSVGGGSGEG